jgi:protoporphyrinogen oxidase
MSERTRPSAVVIGAGPAGLTAAHYLVRRAYDVTVLERDSQVGGIARTVEYKGFRFDIGGHRFFTKVKPVRDLWHAMIGPEMLKRPRLSRIYYRGKFFDYPLKPFNALSGLGIVEAVRVLLSYVWIRLRPIRPEVSVEDWVSNRFGRRLFGIFFKTYTEKVWGIPCNRIGAQWAAQRIKGFSLLSAITNMLFGRWPRRGSKQITTLIDEFEYPRLGPGMMWEAFQRDLEARGGSVRLGATVTRLLHRDGRVTHVEYEQGGVRHQVPAAAVVSSMPLRELVADLDPPAPQHVRDAAASLQYRDFVTVALIIDAPDLFPDNWIYVHDPRVKLGRIQNFKNWSPEMVPDSAKTCLGLEYFCFEGDSLWRMPDRDLVALGARELEAIGLLKGARVVDGSVVRMPKAYPVYDDTYLQALEILKNYLTGFSNLQVVGRNGMHKYNNQDHSMVTAMLAVQNLSGAAHDVWAVNADDEYHEEGTVDMKGLASELEALEAAQPAVPRVLQS